MFHAKIIVEPLLHLKAVSQSKWRIAADIILSLFGIMVMVYTTALTIMSWFDSTRPNLPGYCD